MTLILQVDPHHPEPELIAQAAQVLRQGWLVAFPTETVYGLGAHALDEAAVERIFIAKGRPADDPLIVHLASVDWLPQVAQPATEMVNTLARAFWPGPLTMVLPKAPAVPRSVTAGLNTVAVRVPRHPIALALLRAAGLPVAAPSANRFGHTSPTTAGHVWHDLAGRVDLILDGGPTAIGVESTVLDVIAAPPLILRPGGVTPEELARVIGPVNVRHTQPTAGPQVSPGLLAKHYAPRARLVLCTGLAGDARQKMLQLARLHLAQGQALGLLLADEDAPHFAELPAHIVTLGPAEDMAQIARNLFAAMRALDQAGVTVMLARDFGRAGLGLAIFDRLQRAAGDVVVV
jgi:L-threonylcarbamoyladenylate synthase